MKTFELHPNFKPPSKKLQTNQSTLSLSPSTPVCVYSSYTADQDSEQLSHLDSTDHPVSRWKKSKIMKGRTDVSPR